MPIKLETTVSQDPAAGPILHILADGKEIAHVLAGGEGDRERERVVNINVMPRMYGSDLVPAQVNSTMDAVYITLVKKAKKQ